MTASRRHRHQAAQRGASACAASTVRRCTSTAPTSYIESKGTHSLIHTEDSAHESVETLSSIAQRHSDLFVRCHASYLVNPAFVRDVTRCKVTLQDGSELPIPEKKYTAVKRELAERMG